MAVPVVATVIHCREKLNNKLQVNSVSCIIAGNPSFVPLDRAAGVAGRGRNLFRD
jgi:hypothetical protein